MSANLDISVAPADLSSVYRRQVALYSGPNPYVNGTGDPVDPADVRMGKIFTVLGGTAVGAQAYLIFTEVDPVTGDVFIFWYDPVTGGEVANGVDLSGAQCMVEVIGQ